MAVLPGARGNAGGSRDLDALLAQNAGSLVMRYTSSEAPVRWFKTCFWIQDVTAREETLKRILTTTLWVLAMILPGGLPMLALWVAYKTARQRQQSLTARKSAVTWVAPKQLEADTVTVTGAGTCSVQL